MSREVFLLFLSVLGACHGCLQDPASAYRFTGTVCRLTYPAAVVLNEKTTKVIEAAFQHARYPSMKGEKSLAFIGRVKYGLDNLEIYNLTIGRSAFELRPGEGIAIEISNVSAVFKGTIQYGYGSWLVNVSNSIDFEIESQIDLGINPKLYCGNGKVAADTSDCYLNFHKLHLHLQGDKEPNWLKKLFTNFITLTVKLVIKGQICKEINKAANILADFIQDTAEQFLSDGDISVDISLAAPPVITANYIESYHKGLTNYKNTTAVIDDSVFHPSHLTENRMLYFWVSDQLFNPMISAAKQDGCFKLNISGEELIRLFQTDLSSVPPQFFTKCLKESASPELRVWCSSGPFLNTSTIGTTVSAAASGELYCDSEGTAMLSFQTLQKGAEVEFLREAVEKIGIPKVLFVLQTELTRLLDKQGANLFDIYNPEMLPRDGYVVIQMDFGFPHHLLVEFLKRTL
ncbi:cholesteryl ester transfer protein isoform X2 [Parambassis ranga]|uniref:Cholesteryl ester transfer protein n=1 Tax=Parambassis ranga TaxID=210632 RepID=A0A6P7I6W6_9TELE|nr:cholesteryl ester transfer protein isoform X2 [Parambassis ranga]